MVGSTGGRKTAAGGGRGVMKRATKLFLCCSVIVLWQLVFRCWPQYKFSANSIFHFSIGPISNACVHTRPDINFDVEISNSIHSWIHSLSSVLKPAIQYCLFASFFHSFVSFAPRSLLSSLRYNDKNCTVRNNKQWHSVDMFSLNRIAIHSSFSLFI